MAERQTGLATVTSVEPGRATRDALDEMTEAWRAIEAARRHAYEYHRHAGSGDAHLVRAVGLLRKDGHHDLADMMCKRLIGHGLAADRWAFQVMEEDDDFFRTLMGLEEQARSRSRPQASAQESASSPRTGDVGSTDPEG
jgi:hypothetical protein